MQDSSMEQLWRSSHIAGSNATYVEDLYEAYLKNPNGVPEQWRDYFDKLPWVESAIVQIEGHPALGDSRPFRPDQQDAGTHGATVQHDSQATEYERKQVRVLQISAYRQRGHQKAQLDPWVWPSASTSQTSSWPSTSSPRPILTLFTRPAACISARLTRPRARSYRPGAHLLPCTVGAEFMHIVDTEQRHWIMQRMESVRSAPDYGRKCDCNCSAA